MDFCTGLQRQQTEMATKIKAQDLEISNLKARIKLLKDKDRGSAEPSRDEAPIKGRSMEIGEEVQVERSTELGSNDTKEMVNVLTPMEAVNILTSGVAALVRDAKIARLNAEEELKMMIEGLDRSNEMIEKHLQEYEQSKVELTVGEKIDFINELVKYQDHHAKILKYQAQQSKPLSKKEQREFYMSVLRSCAGWKTRHFRGLTLEEIREKFIHVWKQFEDFVPMASKEEGERVKRKGLKLEQGSAKKMKTSEEVSEKDLKDMMQLVPVEGVYVEALQVKHLIVDWEIHSEGKKDYWKIISLGGHTAVYQFFVDMLKQLNKEDLHQLWALVKETLSIRQALSDKEMKLWVKLKRLFEPDFEDQLWTHNQNLMHDPLDSKLYDACGVHHVSTKDQEIFMLVERDYPLRRGLAIVMISNKLQVGDGSTITRSITHDELLNKGLLATVGSRRYLQNEHYALWKVIEFGDSYQAPPEEAGKGSASKSSAKKKGRIAAITTQDMHKRRNDVKARTNLLLALLDEHQLRFSKYETAQELQQAIVSHLEFMDVEIKQDDLNQKFLISLAPEWLISEKGEVHTASVPTASTQVSTASTDVTAASISHDTVCAYIASQSNGSQIKYEDITQIDEDDIEEIDIKWNMALLSMRADMFWKKNGKKITIQGSDVAGFDKSKRESDKQGPKEEEPAPKALMVIDGIGWDWSYMDNEEENHALVANDEVPTEFTLMAKSSSSSENKFESASKDLDNLLGSQRSDKNKEGLGYNAVSPPAQVYSPPKKDLSWTGLLEFIDDTVTDYSRPTPSIDTSECNSSDLQSSNFFVFEHGESSGSIMSKPMIKFVKAADCPRVIKTNNTKNARKSTVKYAEMYMNTSKSPKSYMANEEENHALVADEEVPT
nr:hypothetical protein [Tanacetum cinerariifolium]